jgi:hypothetical protein
MTNPSGFTVEASSVPLLAAFWNEHGRLPRQSGPDRTEEEARAGNVLRWVRRRYVSLRKPLDRQLLAYLNRNVPGWATDGVRPASRGMRGKTTFTRSAHQVETFVDRHGRLPTAKGAHPNERVLGRWLNNQRQAAKGKGTGAWTPAKQALLDRLVSGWDVPARERRLVLVA